MNDPTALLEEKSRWVRRETLRLHKLAPGTRVASSLSCVEIFAALYYGGAARFDPKDPQWADRDRVILSKGHGCVCFYPILADLGFIPTEELERIAQPGSILGVIPEAIVPGIETTNGSLGHGLGVACGIAIALKRRGSASKVFVLSGDGEMNSGAVWEAVMFAAFHKLDNIILILDDNKLSMLGPQAEILGIAPHKEKLEAFGWEAEGVDGHDAEAVRQALERLKHKSNGAPQALIADTIKGKGIPSLEADMLCHVKIYKAEEVDRILEELP